MNLDDTIASIATPGGYGAIGIIRMSGDLTSEILSKIFVSRNNPVLAPRKQTLGIIIDPSNGEHIDRVLICFYKYPASFTGEDMAEISCHGNPIILRRILLLLNRYNVRTAQAGEFTYRAFINGKMDLTEAEAINRLSRSMTALSAQEALRQAGGSISAKIQFWHDKLVEMYGMLEAEIEFSDETGQPYFEKDVQLKKIDQMLDEVDSLIATHRKGKMMRYGVDLAIVGRANAGKSTLFNYLLSANRSIVTDIPGTTRDVISELIEIEGLPFRLHDTAGLEDYQNLLDREGLKKTEEQLEKSELLLYMIDGSRPLSDKDEIELRRLSSRSCIIVINKIDMDSRIDEGRVKAIVSRETSKISALTGEGIDQLKKKILHLLGWSAEDTSERAVVQSDRQHELLVRFRSLLSDLKEKISESAQEEITTFHLRETLKPLEEITGKVSTGDIYNRIFAEFCIGK